MLTDWNIQTVDNFIFNFFIFSNICKQLYFKVQALKVLPIVSVSCSSSCYFFQPLLTFFCEYRGSHLHVLVTYFIWHAFTLLLFETFSQHIEKEHHDFCCLTKCVIIRVGQFSVTVVTWSELQILQFPKTNYLNSQSDSSLIFCIIWVMYHENMER